MDAVFAGNARALHLYAARVAYLTSTRERKEESVICVSFVPVRPYTARTDRTYVPYTRVIIVYRQDLLLFYGNLAKYVWHAHDGRL